MGSSLSLSAAAAAGGGAKAEVERYCSRHRRRSREVVGRCRWCRTQEVDRNLKSEFVFDDDDVNSKLKTF